MVPGTHLNDALCLTNGSRHTFKRCMYVALSRSTARKNVKILVVPDAGNKKKNSNVSKKKSSIGTYTKNIVYKEILTS
jgi:hypothetical protein